MWELNKKYVTPVYLILMAGLIFYGIWYRDSGENPFALMGIYLMLIPILALLYCMAMGMEERYWLYPVIAAAAGVLVYIFTGNDWIKVDLYALYMLLGYFAVGWLGIGARRLFQNAYEETGKGSGKNKGKKK